MSLHFVTYSSAQQFPRLGGCWLDDDYCLIQVTGEDSKSYLQGQLTCDVVALEAGHSTLGAHCDAKGKIWSLFRLFHYQSGYALLLPRSGASQALAELKKYAVFSKVEITFADLNLLGLTGCDVNSYINNLTSEQAGEVRHLAHCTLVQVSPMQWLAIGTKEALQTNLPNSYSEENSALWQWYEVSAGQPYIGEQNQNKHIPQAVNLQAIGGISFSKGCYIGQETIARAKYRGANKRAMFIVKGELPAQAKHPITLERQVGDNWRSVGEPLSLVASKNNEAIATLILPNDLEPETQLRLTSHPECIWRVQPLPYALNEEE